MATSSDQQAPCPQPSTSSPIDLWGKAAVQTSLKLLSQLMPQIARHYLDSRDCARFSVTCGSQPLDLDWDAREGGDFLRLLTKDEMERIAAQYNYDAIKEIKTDPTHAFSHSMFVADHLYDHLWAIDVSQLPYEDLADGSRWYYRKPKDWEVKKLRWFKPSAEMWTADFFSWLNDCEASNLSHMNCILVQTDDVKLQDDTLMVSEVWCIMMLTLIFYRRHPLVKCKTVPVTVVTIAGTTFRIAQGFVDGIRDAVSVRKSRIMNICGEKQDVTDQMMLIVRWLLAEPIWPSWADTWTPHKGAACD